MCRSRAHRRGLFSHSLLVKDEPHGVPDNIVLVDERKGDTRGRAHVLHVRHDDFRYRRGLPQQLTDNSRAHFQSVGVNTFLESEKLRGRSRRCYRRCAGKRRASMRQSTITVSDGDINTSDEHGGSNSGAPTILLDCGSVND